MSTVNNGRNLTPIAYQARCARRTLARHYYKRLRDLALPPDLFTGANIFERAAALLRVHPSPDVAEKLKVATDFLSRV